jgi:glutathione S-transferase
MITLHHVPLSRSLRVRWLLEELGLRYQLVTRSFADLKQPDHLALHPLGKVPVLRDGDVVLYESGAILQHLLERYGEGRLEPKPGTRERSLYWQWFHLRPVIDFHPRVERCSWDRPQYHELLRRGIRWALGAIDGL